MPRGERRKKSFLLLDKTSDFHGEHSEDSDSQSRASDPEGLGETYLAAPEEEEMLATCSEAHLRDNKVWEQSRKPASLQTLKPHDAPL